MVPTLFGSLSECPIHLKLEPEAAEAWVRDSMEPVFPLGVKKDVTEGVRFPPIPRPTFDPEHTLAALETTTDRAYRFASTFPSHLGPEDVSLKLAGAGGDGAQTTAMLLTQAAINEGFDSTYIPSYGPESRGVTSYADVHIAINEVLSPAAPQPTCWSRSTLPASPSSGRACAPAASSSTTARWSERPRPGWRMASASSVCPSLNWPANSARCR